MKQHLLALTFCALSPVVAAVAGPVTAAEMNGTWKTKGGNEFKVWKIGKEMLQIEFSACFDTTRPQAQRPIPVKVTALHLLKATQRSSSLTEPKMIAQSLSNFRATNSWSRKLAPAASVSTSPPKARIKRCPAANPSSTQAKAIRNLRLSLPAEARDSFPMRCHSDPPCMGWVSDCFSSFSLALLRQRRAVS